MSQCCWSNWLYFDNKKHQFKIRLFNKWIFFLVHCRVHVLWWSSSTTRWSKFFSLCCWGLTGNEIPLKSLSCPKFLSNNLKVRGLAGGDSARKDARSSKDAYSSLRKSSRNSKQKLNKFNALFALLDRKCYILISAANTTPMKRAKADYSTAPQRTLKGSKVTQLQHILKCCLFHFNFFRINTRGRTVTGMLGYRNCNWSVWSRKQR